MEAKLLFLFALLAASYADEVSNDEISTGSPINEPVTLVPKTSQFPSPSPSSTTASSPSTTTQRSTTVSTTQRATTSSTTTSAPIVTTSVPVITTPVPVITTPVPVITTPVPVITTPVPVITTSAKPKPVPATARTSTTKRRPWAPVSTTPSPSSPSSLPVFPAPLAKDPIGVKLFLYTRFHSHAPYMLDPNSIESLKGAYFTFSYTGPNSATARERGKNRKLYIVIHGLQDGIDITPWMRTMKTRLLDVDRDSNVVLVDWSRGAAINLLNDLRFASVRIVGGQAVQLIKGLEALYPESFSPENVHVIAHSFGTFAADVIGRNCYNLGRITGLDPAGGVSNIAQMSVHQRLDPSDAKYVDIIHTDAPKPANAPAGLSSSGLPQIVLPGQSLLSRPAAAAAAVAASGTLFPLGHYDFYPNGGYQQPGCNALATSPAASFLRPLLPAAGAGAANLKKLLSCSHSRAIDLFTESIKSRDAPGCSLLSYSCSNYTQFLEAKCTLCNDQSTSASDSSSQCALMGLHSIDHFNPQDQNTQYKQFYVTTNSRAPYCLYHYGVAVKIAKKPRTANRGGVLLVNLDGEYVSSSSSPNLEVKIVGGMTGFKPGKTVRAIFTHFADVGAIKTATVSWVPAPPNIASILSPSSVPSIYVQAVKVYPMSFAEAQTRKTISRQLCPPAQNLGGPLSQLFGGTNSESTNRNDPPVVALSAFFKEVTFSTNRCTHHNIQHFRSEDYDDNQDNDQLGGNVTLVR